uniref:Uncharacterized protein n=1 Tax=Avena sativa TaxID=4498 RepID=A0ACD6A750_AVESA
MSAKLCCPSAAFQQKHSPLPVGSRPLHPLDSVSVHQGRRGRLLRSSGAVMEKGNGGEKKVEKETGGEKKVEVGAGGEKNPAAAPACFTKTGGEDASLLDTTKGYFKQLQETSADTHWGCIKNRARLAKEYVAEKTSSVFGRKKVEPEVKGVETPAAAKEEGAKPAAPAAGGESH